MASVYMTDRKITSNVINNLKNLKNIKKCFFLVIKQPILIMSGSLEGIITKVRIKIRVHQEQIQLTSYFHPRLCILRLIIIAVIIISSVNYYLWLI